QVGNRSRDVSEAVPYVAALLVVVHVRIPGHGLVDVPARALEVSELEARLGAVPEGGGVSLLERERLVGVVPGTLEELAGPSTIGLGAREPDEHVAAIDPGTVGRGIELDRRVQVLERRRERAELAPRDAPSPQQ